MKSRITITSILLICATTLYVPTGCTKEDQKNFKQEAIFLHQSTGNLVFEEGKVASWIDSYNQSNGTSIEVSERLFPYDPWTYNYPYDYWKLWVGGSCNSSDPDIECLNTLAATYDMVIMKHCSPASHIQEDTGTPDVTSDAKKLENYKAQYRALRSLFDSYPNTKFMVWTLAPLHRLSTSPTKANRANEFVQWVKNEWLTEDGKSHPNIIIFDFFSLVAELDENPVNGVQYCLKYEYEKSHSDGESHPNTLANEMAGPIFADAIVNALFLTSDIKVNGIAVTGTGGATAITTKSGTLQLAVAVAPANATNKNVTWSIQNGTGQASITASGLVTAVADGTVTATATAADGSGVKDSLVITISGQSILVTGITVIGTGGLATITTPGGTLQLAAAVEPADATNKSVNWTIQNGTGKAWISSAGLVTALTNGTITATATAADGSGVKGSLEITITGQSILVTGITVIGTGGLATITTPGGTLQLAAAVEPADATNKSVNWTIQNGTGKAWISSAGLVTALTNGTITATATAADGSGIKSSLTITISGQINSVTGITVTGADGLATITTHSGSLQLAAAVLPADATNKNVTWSIQNGTGQATISLNGLVTAIANGTVTATATAVDGSGINGSLVITITGQTVLVTSITVTGTGGATTITSKSGNLQLAASASPSNATNKNVTWSIQNGTGQASISANGLVTAIANGTATATATAADGSGVKGSLLITISGQNILVTGIAVTAEGGATTITTLGGTVQLTVTVSPENATNKTVTWSIQNGTGQATISSTGLVTAVVDGTATATATATDGSGVKGTLLLTIATAEVKVSAIVIYGTEFTTIIPSIGSTLQLHASIVPQNASEKAVNWSVQNVTGKATITPDGLLTAVSYGEVNAVAKARDGSGVTGTLKIKITNQLPTDLEKFKENPYLIVNNRSTLIILFKPDYPYKQVSLYSLTGILILSEKVVGNPVVEDISILIPGIYILQLLDDLDNIEAVKICKW